MNYPMDATADELITFMAPKGANLLVQGLKYRVFESDEPITHSEASILEMTDGKGIAHAPKITPQHRQIDTWAHLDAETLLRKNQALGDLWDKTTYRTWAQECRKEFPKSKDEPIPSRRLIFSGGFEEFTHKHAEDANQVIEDAEHIRSILASDPPPGKLIFLPRKRWLPKELIVVTADKKLLRVKSCTLEGGQKENGAKELYSVLVSYREAYGRLQKRLKNKGVKKKDLMQRAKERKAAAAAAEKEKEKEST
jgi:hypothetical protein